MLPWLIAAGLPFSPFVRPNCTGLFPSISASFWSVVQSSIDPFFLKIGPACFSIPAGSIRLE